jgi:hypothetical protein
MSWTADQVRDDEQAEELPRPWNAALRTQKGREV